MKVPVNSKAGEKHTNSDSDEEYSPPKRSRAEPKSPLTVFDSDNAEVIEDTEQGEILVNFRCRYKNDLLTVHNRKRSVQVKKAPILLLLVTRELAARGRV